jgi:predicted peptidase
MVRISFYVALLTIFSSSAMAQDLSLFDKLLFVNKNDTLPYRLLKPVSPQSHDSFPLIIFLHGAGERGNDNEVHIKHISDFVLDERNRGKYPCYVLAPQCPKGQIWANYRKEGESLKIADSPSKPMQSLLLLIEQITKEFPIDQSRIYVTGLSMGGYGTWDLIARFPFRFAAAVPICGGGDTRTARQIKHIPIWAFHGALDKIVHPEQSRRMVRALQEAGGIPGYNEYPDIEHNSWVNAYKEPHLVHWLFQQKLVSKDPAK